MSVTEIPKPKNKAAMSSFKMLQAMVGIGVLCALMIVLTYDLTLPVIKQNKAEALEKAVFKVLPGAQKRVTFYQDGESFKPLTQPPTGKEQLVYAGYNKSGTLVGLAIDASGQGFQDIIRILYGYAPQTQTVIGFNVLETKETPGLGDKIEKDPVFLDNFTDLSVAVNGNGSGLQNEVIPVKSGAKTEKWQVDCITGATITSKAIANIINASSQSWVPILYKNRDLFINHLKNEKE